MSSDIASGVIHRLREVMAQLEADKARLDWMDKNDWWKPSQTSQRSVRFQIDEAIRLKEESDRWEAEDYRARMEGMSRG